MLNATNGRDDLPMKVDGIVDCNMGESDDDGDSNASDPGSDSESD